MASCAISIRSAILCVPGDGLDFVKSIRDNHLACGMGRAIVRPRRVRLDRLGCAPDRISRAHDFAMCRIWTPGELAPMTFLASTSTNRVTARRSAFRGGFSAIELLIVCAIVGIFATLAYPRVNFTQFQVDSGA